MDKTKKMIKKFLREAKAIKSIQQIEKITSLTCQDKIKENRSSYRKRKTEKQLSILQTEIRSGDPLWSKAKIEQLSQVTGMGETSIYKWWWDQTRKRVKRLKETKINVN